MVPDAIRRAAAQQILEEAMAVRRHGDEIDLLLGGHATSSVAGSPIARRAPQSHAPRRVMSSHSRSR